MIITKTPVRISLGAGGTDLPGFYSRYGSSFVTAAGSKFTYVLANRHPEKVVWMGLQQAERVDSPDRLNHRVVKEALNYLGLKRNIEIVSIADVLPNSGMGTSGSFVVGLLNALHAYKGEYLWPTELADEAYFLEHDLLHDRTGKQDHYAAALGGIVWMEISKDGRVAATHLNLNPDFVAALNERVAFFFTGISRSSKDIQQWEERLNRGDERIAGILKDMQRVSNAIRSALLKEDIPYLAELLTEHWNLKKQLSRGVTNDLIDRRHRQAMREGAVGGNLMGAGGGGTFFFICKDSLAKSRLRKSAAMRDLQFVDMALQMRGTTVVDV